MIKYLGLLFIPLFLSAQIRVKIDLTAVTNDQLNIVMDIPITIADSTVFSLPKVVPGTYATANYGQFVRDIRAYTSRGQELEVKRLNVNQWVIPKKTSSVRYTIDDTYDQQTDIFQPAGTNFEAGENFILNPFGVIGYLEGQPDLSYSIDIAHPEGWYGSTSLEKIYDSKTYDTYADISYVDLADAPIMYCRPDTAITKIANAEVMVSSYSPGNNINSSEILETITPLLEAQKTYLGGVLPVDRYVFIMYFSPMFGGSFGALEHSYSSLYFLPNFNIQFLRQTIQDVAAHEFFHIVTPLNIHSYEIEDFDFSNPEMSQHLWLYEGLVEYMAHHVQVVQQLITPEEFLQVIQTKIRNASVYSDTLPFTKMSENILNNYTDQYLNVYEKGMLINLCLDIVLLKYSGGEYSIIELVNDLSEKYGNDRPFKDEELFSVIEEIASPEAGDFLRRYVGGSSPLPLKDILKEVGITYARDTIIQKATLGNVRLVYSTKDKNFYISDTTEMNEMGKALGWNEGDVILNINGVKIGTQNFRSAIEEFKLETRAGELVKIEVLRDDETLILQGNAITEGEEVPLFLNFDSDVTEAERRLRNQWLGINP